MKKVIGLVLLAVALCAAAVVADDRAPYQKAADGLTTNCTAITASSQQVTLPKGGAWYYVKASGNNAYVLCGSNPTATTAVNGHFTVISEGETLLIRLVGPKCAHIGTSAVGEICYVQLVE